MSYHLNHPKKFLAKKCNLDFFLKTNNVFLKCGKSFLQIDYLKKKYIPTQERRVIATFIVTSCLKHLRTCKTQEVQYRSKIFLTVWPPK